MYYPLITRFQAEINKCICANLLHCSFDMACPIFTHSVCIIVCTLKFCYMELICLIYIKFILCILQLDVLSSNHILPSGRMWVYLSIFGSLHTMNRYYLFHAQSNVSRKYAWSVLSSH